MPFREISGRFARFWLAPEPRVNAIVARALLAVCTLWIILSRRDLPSIVGLPSAVWQTVPMQSRFRFLLILPIDVERLLWAALHLALVAALFGLWNRWSCFTAGLLLYHFGPLETIVWTPNPYLRGMTIPCLGFLIFSFADLRKGSEESGWALRLIQLLFAEIYFFAGYAKLFTSGIAWLGAQNIRDYLLALDQFLGFSTQPTISHWLAERPWICSLIAFAGLLFDLAFPIALFWRRSRWFFIPVGFFFHVANWLVFHVFFQNAFLLLIFVDWQWILTRVPTGNYARAAAREKDVRWVSTSG